MKLIQILRHWFLRSLCYQSRSADFWQFIEPKDERHLVVKRCIDCITQVKNPTCITVLPENLGISTDTNQSGCVKRLCDCGNTANANTGDRRFGSRCFWHHVNVLHNCSTFLVPGNHIVTCTLTL